MNTYELWVTVRLNEPMDSEDSKDAAGDPLIRYLQIFGVTAASGSEACAIVEATISDGVIEEYKGGEKPILAMDARMQARYHASAGHGVWYKSGRAFVPAG